MTVVLDTNVLVAALRSKTGAAGVLWEMVLSGVIEIAMSVASVLEYEEVLKRDAPGGIRADEVDDLLAFAFKIAHRYPSIATSVEEVLDPDDAFVLRLARHADVDHLVTYNVRDFRRSSISVVTPPELLAIIRSQ